MRCAELQEQTIVAAVLNDQFRSIACTGIDKHANGIGSSALISLSCGLAQSVVAKLSFTVLKNAPFLFKLRLRERLLSIATKQ